MVDRNVLRERTRAKVLRKAAWKRSRLEGDGGGGEREVSVKEALAELSNDILIAPTFLENHVCRDTPSRQAALDVAERRKKDKSTTLFLEDTDLDVLAEDVRGFHARLYRRRGANFTLFDSDRIYPFIDATWTPTPGAPGGGHYTVSDLCYGRITFAMTKVGDVDLGHEKKPVYAIHHLEKMEITGQEQDTTAGSDVDGEESDSEEGSR